MVQFASITKHILDDHDRLGIITHIYGALKESEMEDDPTINSLQTTFLSLEDKLTIAMNRENGNNLTDAINEHHKERIHCLKGIRSGLGYFLDHEDPEKARASAIISRSFNKYMDRITNRKKLTYTTEIGNFLEEMGNERVAPLIESLVMTDKIAMLERAQASFITLTKRRAEEEEMEDTPSVTETREEIHQIIDVLKHHLYYQQYLGSTPYEELTLKLNGRINEIMTIAKSRNTHGEHSEIEDDTMSDHE